MQNRDEYFTGLVVAFLLRFGMLCGLLAIMAMMSACSPTTKAVEALKEFSADADISRREGNQTRNYIPPDGGCNEKSDSSLRKPLS